MTFIDVETAAQLIDQAVKEMMEPRDCPNCGQPTTPVRSDQRISLGGREVAIRCPRCRAQIGGAWMPS